MSRQSEDDAWRSIVENYGERAEIEPDAEAETKGAELDQWEDDDDDIVDVVVDDDDIVDVVVDDDERFVPPPPPPLPHPPPVRLAAWIGVFGAPAVLLVSMVLALPLPGWLAKGLVAYFAAGFLYLVFHMDRGPRDPWDNGARV